MYEINLVVWKWSLKRQVFINRYLRTICRIFWSDNIKHSDLWNITNKEPIITQIKRRKIERDRPRPNSITRMASRLKMTDRVLWQADITQSKLDNEIKPESSFQNASQHCARHQQQEQHLFQKQHLRRESSRIFTQRRSWWELGALKCD